MINDGVSGGDEAEGEGEGGVDLVGKIASENFQAIAEECMTDSANLHKEFWMELREEKPDLRKLNYLGSRFNSAMNNAKDYWNRLQKYTLSAQFLKIYGRFLIDIQNERSGEELIKKAKILEKRDHDLRKFKENAEEEDGDLEGASSEPLPYVIVAGGTDNLGKIKKANALFSILVGMQHDEIIDRKINSFMPELFAMFHDNFMTHYLQREDDSYTGFLNQENSLFIKNKSGYVLPLYIKVKPLETVEGIQFLGTFRTENIRKLYVYFICRHDGLITDISASAITVLNLNLLSVRKNNMNIESIVPNALKDKGYRGEGKDFSYDLKEFDGTVTSTIQLLAVVTPIELRDRTNKEFTILARDLTGLQTVLQAKETTAGDDSVVYGYVVRIEKIEKTAQMNKGNTEMSRFKTRANRGPTSLKKESSLDDASSPVKTSITKRESNPASSKALGLEKEKEDLWIYGFRTDKDDLEISAIFQSANLKKELDKANEDNEVAQVREEINYAGDIRTKRLVNGRFIDVRVNGELETEERKRLEEEWNEEDSLFRKKDDDEGFGEQKTKKTKTLKKMIQEALESTTELPSVKSLRLTSLIWVVIALGFSSALFSLLLNYFYKYDDYTQITTYSAKRLSRINDVVSALLDLSYLSEDPSLVGSSMNTDPDLIRAGLQSTVNEVISITSSLDHESFAPLFDPYTQTEIPIRHYDNGTIDIPHDQTDSLMQVLGLAYNMTSQSLSDVSISNRNLRNVLYNIQSRIYPQFLADFKNFTSEILNEYSQGTSDTMVILSVILLLCGLVFTGVIVYYLIKIESQKENVLFLFLEIPMKNIEGISKRRDKFMDFFQAIKNTDKNKDSDASDSLDDISEIRGKNENKDISLSLGGARGEDSATKQSEEDEEEDQLKKRKKMIKRYKTQKFDKARVMFAKVFVVMLLCCFYVVCALLLLYFQKTRLSQYMTQISTDSLITSRLQVGIDLVLLYGLDPDFPMANGTVQENTERAILDVSNHDLSSFYVYLIGQNSDFTNTYKEVFFGDACSYYGTDIEKCHMAANSSLKTGILNFKVQMFKFLKNVYLQLANEYNGTATPIDNRLQVFTADDDLNTFPDTILWQFLEYERQFLKDDLTLSVTISTILLVVYIVLVVIFCLLYWLPVISRLNNEVWRTTRMINMIPIDVVQRIRSIRIFLRKLIRSRARGY